MFEISARVKSHASLKCNALLKLDVHLKFDERLKSDVRSKSEKIVLNQLHYGFYISLRYLELLNRVYRLDIEVSHRPDPRLIHGYRRGKIESLTDWLSFTNLRTLISYLHIREFHVKSVCPLALVLKKNRWGSARKFRDIAARGEECKAQL